VAMARESLARGDYEAAQRNASRALAFNPVDVRSCRVMAEVATITHLPTELVWWQRTTALAPTTENKLGLAQAALHCQTPPFPLAAQILGELAAIGPTNASYQETAAMLALNAQQPGEAEARLVTACQLDSRNHEYALNLALFQLHSAKSGEKIPARARVEELAVDENLRSTALRALVTDTVQDGNETAAFHYSTLLLAVASATLEDQLQNLEILQRLQSPSFAARLATVEKAAENNPPVMAEISDWMRAHGLVKENIGWLTQLPDYLLSRPPVAAALAQSYLENGNWQTLLDFASHGDWDDLDYLRLAAVSHAWAQLGMATLAEGDWGEAVRKASYHLDAVTNLLALAQAWQLKPEADDLLQREHQLER
jgi:hypothetical protein